jgi:hypothetical protein
MKKRLLLTWAIAATLVACSAEPGPAGDLRQAQVPPNFTFATQRGVALSVQAPDRVFGDVGAAQLEVRTPTGEVLYRGSIRRGAAAEVAVLAPSAAARLVLRATGRAGEAEGEVEVRRDRRIDAKLR